MARSESQQSGSTRAQGSERERVGLAPYSEYNRESWRQTGSGQARHTYIRCVFEGYCVKRRFIPSENDEGMVALARIYSAPMGATAHRRHRLDVMTTTRLSPLSLHAEAKEEERLQGTLTKQQEEEEEEDKLWRGGSLSIKANTNEEKEGQRRGGGLLKAIAKRLSFDSCFTDTIRPKMSSVKCSKGENWGAKPIALPSLQRPEGRARPMPSCVCVCVCVLSLSQTFLLCFFFVCSLPVTEVPFGFRRPTTSCSWCMCSRWVSRPWRA